MKQVKNAIIEKAVNHPSFTTPSLAAAFKAGGLFALQYLEEHGFIPATLEEVAEEPETISTLHQVSIKAPEGRLLMAALAMLTVTTHASNTPDEVIGELNQLALKMFTEEEPDKRYKPLPDCPLPVEHLTEKQKQELIYGKPEDWSKGQVTLQQLQEVKDQAERLLNKIQDLRDQQSASRSSWKPDHDAPEMIHSFLQDCRSTAKNCKNILDVAILERSNNPAS